MSPQLTHNVYYVKLRFEKLEGENRPLISAINHNRSASAFSSLI